MKTHIISSRHTYLPDITREDNDEFVVRMFAHYDMLCGYYYYSGVPLMVQKRKMNVVTKLRANVQSEAVSGAKMTPQQRGALAGNQKAQLMRETARPAATAVCVCGSKCISVGGCVDTCRISALT